MKTRKELTNNTPVTATHEAIYDILRDAIGEHTGNGVRASDLFIYDVDTGLMSHSLECRNHYGSLSSMAYHEFVTVRMSMLTMQLRMPPIMVDGKQSELYVYTLEHLATYAKIAKIKLPFDPLDPKSGIRYVTRDSSTVYASDSNARFTDPAKVVTCINNFLKYVGFEPMPTIKTNPILAGIESARKLGEYHCEWATDDVSDIYSNESDSDNYYTSCMAGKPSSYFELYDDLQKAGSLRLIHLLDGAGNRKGRALCWVGNNPADFYLDRLYVPEFSSVQDPLAHTAFEKFCAANNIHKTVYQKTADALGLELKSISIELPYSIHNYDYAPYVDSMYRVCEDGKLRNHSGGGSPVITELHNTDGSIELEPEEPEGIFICRHGDTFPEDECIETRDGVWELESECHRLESHYYGYSYAHEVDCVKTHDGNYILLGDAVDLYDGTCSHTDEVTLLEDGSDLWALTTDCAQLSDGRWVLTADVASLEAELLEAEADADADA